LYIDTLKSLFHSKAGEWGYESELSIATYINSSNIKWKQQALMILFLMPRS